MVGMQPTGYFCETGAPVIDDEGALVAIGGPRQAGDGTFLTRLVDVAAIRATLQAWQEEGRP